MTAYLAARYSRRKEMAALVPVLKEAGIHVNSRWLSETVDPKSDLRDVTPTFCRQTASDDLADIDVCDTLVFFSEDPMLGFKRGGRHVELGYALAKGKRIVVVGGEENVFHFLPTVIHYPTFDSFLEGERIDNADVAD